VKRRVLEFVKGYSWGANGLTVLYLSLFSGVIVSLQFDPQHPYYSVSAFDILVPFGEFWRSLHFYASQLFFIMMIGHILAVVTAKKHHSIGRASWLSLVVSFLVLILILFSGYLLRGDATGSSAGAIAEHIALSIPIFGRYLSSWLFALDEMGVRRVYSQHVIGLGLFWLALSWSHIRRYKLKWYSHGFLVPVLLLFSALVAAPVEPEGLGVFKIMGPWFFIGIQELLHLLPPFWAGVIFPLILVTALCGLNYGGRVERISKRIAALWFTCYAALTGAALLPLWM